MTNKHAPAPWRINNEFGRFVIYAPASDCLEIARIRTIGDGEDDFEECEANAKLIAASPELLELLIDLIENEHYQLNAFTINRIQSAINKATGEQQ